MVKRKGVCGGYAKAMQYLLNRLGIECTYICGDTKEGYHAWNLLKLEGDYYYLDSTWGDSSNTDPAKNKSEIDYDYFCITTSELLRDHTPDSSYPVPQCTATKCNYHVRNGLYFTECSLSRFRQAVERIVYGGGNYVSLKFSSEGVYDDSVRLLVHDGGVNKIIRTFDSGKTRCKTWKYREQKDRYSLELFFDN